MESAAVCCVADVPVIHLSYFAERYGKFAIGFHRDAAIRHGFNPVFYSLHDAAVVRSFNRGFARIQSLDAEVVRIIQSNIEDLLGDATPDLLENVNTLGVAADFIESEVAIAHESIQRFLAFVKTFSKRELQTIYCEREWRAVRTFKFNYEDVAMIVIPRTANHGHYFAPFIRSRVMKLNLPRSIPIVPWEDLVES
jgi:hypothetical protein